jgi:pyridoxal phosphate enzyme (YggS family)
MIPTMNEIAQHRQAVLVRLQAACAAAGREPGAVRLLAVSKTFDADAVFQAWQSGQREFGENYIQEGVDKIARLRELAPDGGLVWHCIGPVQSNKTRLVAEHFDWLHTVDRLKIAQRLNEQRPAHLPPLNVCVQVNIDGGQTKSGVAPPDVLALAQAVRELPRLRLRGLMTIPDPADDMLAVHRRARAVFEDVQRTLAQPDFDTLSMGMSGDMDAAVQAGSTMVRVGSAIFGTRPPKTT